jgi:hypothetical protein
MTTEDSATAVHQWRFFRSGGFDQVAIESGEDLRHLAALDLKLWTALNCPAAGLEFDPRTLALLDGDDDGQIRVPEILAAVRWCCEMLKDPDTMFAAPGLAPGAIDDSHAGGAKLAGAAAKLLHYLGKTPDDLLQVADFADMTRLFAPDHPNGDGVVPAALTDDSVLRQAIADVIVTQEAESDRSGEPGITAATLAAFREQAEQVLAWYAEGDEHAHSVRPLGDATAAAAEVFEAVRAKVDDYFTRCRLAAFDANAAAALNPAAGVYGAFGDRALATADSELAALPLAAIVAGKPLSLDEGINPAWADAIARLRDEVVAPLLGERQALEPQDWNLLAERFAAYRDWLARRPQSGVHLLDVAHLRQTLAGDVLDRLTQLIEHDLAADTSAANIDAVERLVRYQRDLVQLLRNFVTLSDFYSGQRKGIFQAGTLYLDQRSCELVMRVSDMARHASMAPFSGCYLVYCSCVRKGCEPITIVAALTGGEVDELMVPGRNGVFYDREGRDWKATIVKIVEQPVSIRQAFWSPYRRLGRFIEAQLQKFAASREQAVETRTTGGVTEVASAIDKPAGAGAQAFDIAKFAGIFAAIGLALGAIGTMMVALVSGLISLPAWQLPLVVLGLMLLISAPSMLMAYLALRRRSLGPLLDANGWAMNARARINVPFGASLTGVAALPAGSRRSLIDPFAEKPRPWKTWLALGAVVIVAITLWQQGLLAQWYGATVVPGAGETALVLEDPVAPSAPE